METSLQCPRTTYLTLSPGALDNYCQDLKYFQDSKPTKFLTIQIVKLARHTFLFNAVVEEVALHRVLLAGINVNIVFRFADLGVWIF